MSIGNKGEAASLLLFGVFCFGAGNSIMTLIAVYGVIFHLLGFTCIAFAIEFGSGARILTWLVDRSCARRQMQLRDKEAADKASYDAAVAIGLEKSRQIGLQWAAERRAAGLPALFERRS